MNGRAWTEAEVSLLKQAYADTSNTELGTLLGRKPKYVASKGHSLGLRKSAAFLSSAASGRMNACSDKSRAHQFKPGLIPWNKGMKGINLGNGAGRFKKGHLSGRAEKRLKPLGYRRVTDEGYHQIKIREDGPTNRRWKMVHVLMWEAEHGPVPAGHCVVFRNGDKNDLRLDNLELISRAENMRRNTRHNLPEAINQLIHARAVLVRAINRRTK